MFSYTILAFSTGLYTNNGENSIQFNNLIDDLAFEIVLASFLAFLAVILALGESVTDKQYQKKYIIISYALYFVQLVVLQYPILIFLISFSIIWILSGINLTYSNASNSLESELGKLKMLLYQLVRWFIISKTYLILYSVIIYSLFFKTLEINIYASLIWIVLCILLMSFFLKKVLKFNITNNFIMVLTFILSIVYFLIRQNRLYEEKYLLIFSSLFFIICMLFHLFTNAMDSFDAIAFSETRNKILNYSDRYFNDIKDYSNKAEIVQALSFILFMEDKDFFTRKKHTFSLLSVIKRKVPLRLSLYSLIEILINKLYSKNKDEEIQEKKIKNPILRLFYIFQCFIEKIKGINRGFSTPQTQFIRTNSLNENSYKYTVRRKFFSEWIYTPMFFIAWERFIRRSLIMDRNDAKKYAKIRLLLAYLYAGNIFNGNYKKEKLVNSFSSRLPKEIYLKEWDNFKAYDEFNLKLEVYEGLKLVESIYNKNKK